MKVLFFQFFTGKPGRNANKERIMDMEEKGKWGV